MAHQAAERGLRGVVGGDAAARLEAGHRGHEHDRGARIEHRESGAGGEHGAAQVDGQHGVPGLRRGVGQPQPRGDADVVDDAVEPLERGRRVGHHGVDGRRVGHVGDQRRRRASGARRRGAPSRRRCRASRSAAATRAPSAAAEHRDRPPVADRRVRDAVIALAGTNDQDPPAEQPSAPRRLAPRLGGQGRHPAPSSSARMRSPTVRCIGVPDRRPSMAPLMSADGRFWLSLRFPSSRVIGELDADDRPELLGDELARRVVDRPRVALAGLVAGGEPAHEPGDPRRVVVDDERSGGVEDLVVPRRHDLARLLLGRVPARRDVRIRPGEDGQRVHVPAGVAPLSVGAGEVADQRAQLAGVTVEQQRDDRRGQSARRDADQVRRPARLDGVVQRLEIRHVEGRGAVHGDDHRRFDEVRSAR